MHNPPRKASTFWWCFLMLFFLLGGCSREQLEAPEVAEFSKEKREKLGNMINQALLESDSFQLLPQQAPYDSLYWYIQNLYDQATFSMRLDNHSPTSDRWRRDNPWEVKIFQTDTLAAAFVLPGGDLYISTGMLKLFEEEYELYYILTFEAALMNDLHLLTRLIKEYNSLTIQNIVEGKASANAVSVEIIAEELPYLIFEESEVEAIDAKTVNTICETSVFGRTGIRPLLEDYFPSQIEWLQTRTTYEGRANGLLEFVIESNTDCGNLTSNGGYEKYVLGILP